MGRQVTAAQEKYIHNLARTIAGQVGINSEKVQSRLNPSSPHLGGNILKDHGDAITAAIGCWSPETLGKIAACGPDDSSNGFSLSQVRYPGERIDWSPSGYDLLLNLATTTVVAAIADNIRADFRKALLTSGANSEPAGSVSRAKPYRELLSPEARAIQAQVVRGAMEVGGGREPPPDLDFYDNRRDTRDGSYEGRYGKFDC